jgi:hypothetical protein
LLGLLIALLPETAASATPSARVPSTAIGTLLRSLHDPTGVAQDLFGYSVAVAGSTAVVGALGANSEAGAAFIYSKGAAGWPKTPTATLEDPQATAGDRFGISVALSGNTVVVGAYGTSSFAGAAYIYVKGASGWPTTPTVALEDPGWPQADNFGISVGLSRNTLVVGADAQGVAAGAAYIYVKTANGWPTRPKATLHDPAASADDIFGDSVAVSGSTAVVGAAGTSSYAGAAYIYVKGASSWPTMPTATLQNPTRDAGGFGYSAAVSGNSAVVGAYETDDVAGAAYIYVKGTSAWPTTPTTSLKDPAATPDDSFGLSVAVSGATAVVGAYMTNSSAGAAYMYVSGASGWPTTPTATLRDLGAELGISVAVSGKAAFVGATGTDSYAGAAYIYRA